MANKKFTGTTAYELFYYLVELGYDPDVIRKILKVDEVVTTFLRFMTALTAGVGATQLIRCAYLIIIAAIENGLSNKYIKTILLMIMLIASFYGYMLTSSMIIDEVFKYKRNFAITKFLRHFVRKAPKEDPEDESEDAAV